MDGRQYRALVSFFRVFLLLCFFVDFLYYFYHSTQVVQRAVIAWRHCPAAAAVSDCATFEWRQTVINYFHSAVGTHGSLHWLIFCHYIDHSFDRWLRLTLSANISLLVCLFIYHIYASFARKCQWYISIMIFIMIFSAMFFLIFSIISLYFQRKCHDIIN